MKCPKGHNIIPWILNGFENRTSDGRRMMQCPCNFYVEGEEESKFPKPPEIKVRKPRKTKKR
jgi:hypothetical protein